MAAAKRFLGNALLATGLAACLYGVAGTYVLCVYIIEEWINGIRTVNRFSPDVSGVLAFWGMLPELLVNTVQDYMTASFVTFIFSPLVLTIVPPLALFLYGNWSLLLFGWAPFFAGIALFIGGGLLRADGEGGRPAQRESVRKKPETPSAPSRE